MSIGRFYPVFITILVFLLSFDASAGRRPDWKTKDVNLNAGAGRRIKAIHYPEGKEVHTRRQKKTRIKKKLEKKQRPAKPNHLKNDSVSIMPPKASTGTVMVNTIESPPINGFIPWVAVSVTDARVDSSEIDFYAQKELALTGEYLPDNPQGNFTIGLFDTGASAHVIGYESSQIVGLGYEYDTGSEIEISGVTGTVDAWVTNPLGMFIAGLNSINTATMTLDTSKLVGESNMAVAVGYNPQPGAPDLPTAIGSPMSIYFTTVMKNDDPVLVHFNGINYTAPNIEIFDNESDDPKIPDYPIKVPLELRPAGAQAIAYFPTIGDDMEFPPSTPSVIIANSTQSLFFVHAVDITDGTYSDSDRDKFMIDTGAQVTVIGNQVASRLGIDPANPEFVVDIEGVNGQVVPISGFYIDSFTIPALGEWITFTDVPVILLEIPSPEGGMLDGIIGMNLFNEYNMIFHGGGMFLQDDPSLELELITTPPATLTGDIAPNPVDGAVDMQDMSTCMQAWLSSSGDANFNYLCDIAPESRSDGKVNFHDFALMAANWMKSISPTTLPGDVAPDPVDGVVDMQDLSTCMQAWLSSSGDANFNHLCDIAPESQSDGIINLRDLAIMAANWLKEISPR